MVKTVEQHIKDHEKVRQALLNDLKKAGEEKSKIHDR